MVESMNNSIWDEETEMLLNQMKAAVAQLKEVIDREPEVFQEENQYIVHRVNTMESHIIKLGELMYETSVAGKNPAHHRNHSIL